MVLKVSNMTDLNIPRKLLMNFSPDETILQKFHFQYTYELKNFGKSSSFYPHSFSCTLKKNSNFLDQKAAFLPVRTLKNLKINLLNMFLKVRTFKFEPKCTYAICSEFQAEPSFSVNVSWKQIFYYYFIKKITLQNNILPSRKCENGKSIE